MGVSGPASVWVVAVDCHAPARGRAHTHAHSLSGLGLRRGKRCGGAALRTPPRLPESARTDTRGATLSPSVRGIVTKRSSHAWAESRPLRTVGKGPPGPDYPAPGFPVTVPGTVFKRGPLGLCAPGHVGSDSESVPSSGRENFPGGQVPTSPTPTPPVPGWICGLPPFPLRPQESAEGGPQKLGSESRLGLLQPDKQEIFRPPSPGAAGLAGGGVRSPGGPQRGLVSPRQRPVGAEAHGGGRAVRRSEPAGGGAGGPECLLNPERPRGGGEAAGHRLGGSKVEERERGKGRVSPGLLVCVPAPVCDNRESKL
nr:translation initiation factor IF-2-like [Symphalangus syndactylus]